MCKGPVYRQNLLLFGLLVSQQSSDFSMYRIITQKYTLELRIAVPYEPIKGWLQRIEMI